jgi:hypothetical protein
MYSRSLFSAPGTSNFRGFRYTLIYSSRPDFKDFRVSLIGVPSSLFSVYGTLNFRLSYFIRRNPKIRRLKLVTLVTLREITLKSALEISNFKEFPSSLILNLGSRNSEIDIRFFLILNLIFY